MKKNKYSKPKIKKCVIKNLFLNKRKFEGTIEVFDTLIARGSNTACSCMCCGIF